MVTKTPIIINGSKHTINRILKDSQNYIKISDLKGKGFEVGYDAATKTPSINNTIREQPLLVNGKDSIIKAVNINDTNYVPIRDIVAALGNRFDVEYDSETGTVVINQRRK